MSDKLVDSNYATENKRSSSKCNSDVTLVQICKFSINLVLSVTIARLDLIDFRNKMVSMNHRE